MRISLNSKRHLVLLSCLLFGLALIACVMLGSKPSTILVKADGQAPLIVSIGGIEVDCDNKIANLPSAIKGTEYKSSTGENYKIVATGTSPLTYTAKEHDDNTYGCMPKGLHLNSETGEFYGTIEETGSVGFSIFVSNEYGEDQVLCFISIFEESDKPVITTESLPKGAMGSYYHQYIDFTGYYEQFSVDIVNGSLPDGLSVGKAGRSAQIFGTPTKLGDFTFTLSIHNGAGRANKEYTITISEESIRPQLIPSETIVNDNYSEVDSSGYIHVVKGKSVNLQLVSSGTNTADNPIKYSLEDSLPEGLTLSEDGVISGTPSQNIETSGGNKYHYGINIMTGNKKLDGSPQSSVGSITIVVWDNGHAQITLLPETASVIQGEQLQFEIKWRTHGDVDKNAIVWKVVNNRSQNTTISDNGLLTVDILEESVTIWVEVTHTPSGRSSNSIITIVKHAHDTVHVDKKEKTCETDGYIEHYKCTKCGAMFEDKEATKHLTESQVTIKASHEYTFVAQKNPTCTSNGMQAHYECSECPKLFDGSYNEKTASQLEIPVNENAHKFTTWQSEKPADCAIEGIKGHQTCEYCNKHFDNYGVEIEDLVIPKNDNHNKESAWSKDESGHWHACTREGCKDNGKLDFEAHTKSAEQPTEEHDVHCTVCGFVIHEAKNHVHGLKLVPAKDATCTENGAKAYYVCSEGDHPCGKFFEDAEGTKEITAADIESWKLIPAHHSFGDWNEGTAANCATEGIKAHKTCSMCHKHFDDNDVEIEDLVIPKNDDHKKENACSKDESGHWHACTREGCKDNGKLDFEAHTKSAEQPTEEHDVHCTVCGFVIASALGHTHTPADEWSHDESHHWHECTGCSDQQLDKAPHSDKNSDGKCDDCGFTMQTKQPEEDNPADISGDNNGLSGGAVVGIVIGSIVVVGVSGFAIYWFVVKKKKWEDLVAIFIKK